MSSDSIFSVEYQSLITCTQLLIINYCLRLSIPAINFIRSAVKRALNGGIKIKLHFTFKTKMLVLGGACTKTGLVEQPNFSKLNNQPKTVSRDQKRKCFLSVRYAAIAGKYF